MSYKNQRPFITTDKASFLPFAAPSLYPDHQLLLTHGKRHSELFNARCSCTVYKADFIFGKQISHQDKVSGKVNDSL
jgi:hypothetical protein